MARPVHPKKDVEAALKYAEGRGWSVEMASGHAWGRLKCPCHTREGCQVSVWSTPRNPGNHGKQLRRVVDRCDCKEA